MKKVLAMFLLALLVFGSISISSFAYSGGRLQGLTAQIGQDKDHMLTTTNLITDGNTSTYYTLQNYNTTTGAGGNDSSFYELATEYTITDYQALITHVGTLWGGNTVAIYFYNSSWTQVGLVYGPNGSYDYGIVSSGTKTSITPVQNVKYIMLSEVSGYNTANVYEFDVFGTPDITPPADVSGISVTSKLQTTATLKFTTPSTVDFNIYKIYKGTTLVYTSPAGEAKSSAKTFPLTSLTASTPYTYKVTTVDTVGNESAGSSTTFTTLAVPDTTPPTIPAGLTGTAGIEQATLNWTAVTGVSDLTGYNVYRSGVKQNTTILTGTTYNQSELIAGQTYTYTVRAVDSTGNISIDSTSVDVIPLAPPDTTAPVTPSGLTATLGNTTATISWEANTDPDITGYNVYRDGVKINMELVTDETYTDFGLTNGVVYIYTITAVDTSENESDESAGVDVTPQLDAPRTPLDLNASAADSLVELSWESDNNVDSYNIKRSTVSGGPYETVTNVAYGTTSYVDETVVNDTTYYYVVSSINNGGESPDSNEISVTPQELLEPTLNVVITEETVAIGQEFTADIVLTNVTNIYAEDFTIEYDNTLFDYLGFELVTGYRVYNEPVDDNGVLRFIVASQGADYGITGEKIFIKLKLQAKAVGIGSVDALQCRIADTEAEFDLEELACGADTVTIENQDVNRSGEYTLLDLAIEGFYYGQLASDANPVLYSVDQIIDTFVNDDDLLFIVNKMLLNGNYTPNSYN